VQQQPTLGTSDLSLSPNDTFDGPTPAQRLQEYLERLSPDLDALDIPALTERVVRSAPPGVTQPVLRELTVHTAAGLTFEEPQNSKLAARILADELRQTVAKTGARSFSASIQLGHSEGIIHDRVLKLVTDNAEALDAAIKPERDYAFEYFGLRTLRDRYLQRHPKTRDPIETPQFFFMRVAVGVSDNIPDALELYETFSTHDYLPSSPTLFNAATHRTQLSSCYLLDSPADDLRDIYKRYADIAMLSKFAGGIGLSYTRVRSSGSHIQGTNGQSNGIVPFLNTLDASVSAVNQGGRRKGAACVYLEPWHADIESFLELRDNTGDEARRTHNLNLSNWIPDLFMKRVETNGTWSLFDPKEMPQLVDTYGAEFERHYLEAEKAGRFVRQIKARDLYGRMMRTLAQTGNGWMCFKDASNKTCNQTAEPGRVVHLSNLCTEILEVTSGDETAVCNLGSINLRNHLVQAEDGSWTVDFAKLGKTAAVAIRQLDRVIDRNLYPIPEASNSNMKWRPVGLGSMGLQDVFFKMGVPFDDPRAQDISKRIAETIYFHATQTSMELAKELGAHPAFAETRAARGHLQPDLWGVTPVTAYDWAGLRKDVVEHGLRNSLMIAIAPTATIASILGIYECIEPQVSNLFKRETLSGEFLQVNRYLVQDLRRLGLWNAEIRQQLKVNRGSVAHIDELPDNLKKLYRTAWELSMKTLVDLAADRGAFIDQSQSLNLFVESPNIGRLSSMYMYAWKKGLKTTYYLRSRPATEINMSAQGKAKSDEKQVFTPAEALACSLENPEHCDACQ
jgi:ribonucleoside-diphosphate reductase alpha chain